MSLEDLKRVLPHKQKPGRLNKKTGKTSPPMDYIDARQVMDLLDEVVGMGNWQADYKVLDGKMYCGIGIDVSTATPKFDHTKYNFDKAQAETYYKKAIELEVTGEGRPNPSWVWKWNMGTESDFEAEKGEASDAFKRAAVLWGIGRFLYEKTPKPMQETSKSMQIAKGGNCSKCGAVNKYSEKHSKWYCGDLCWKK